MLSEVCPMPLGTHEGWTTDKAEYHCAVDWTWFPYRHDKAGGEGVSDKGVQAFGRMAGG